MGRQTGLTLDEGPDETGKGRVNKWPRRGRLKSGRLQGSMQRLEDEEIASYEQIDRHPSPDRRHGQMKPGGSRIGWV